MKVSYGSAIVLYAETTPLDQCLGLFLFFFNPNGRYFRLHGIRRNTDFRRWLDDVWDISWAGSHLLNSDKSASRLAREIELKKSEKQEKS